MNGLKKQLSNDVQSVLSCGGEYMEYVSLVFLGNYLYCRSENISAFFIYHFNRLRGLKETVYMLCTNHPVSRLSVYMNVVWEIFIRKERALHLITTDDYLSVRDHRWEDKTEVMFIWISENLRKSIGNETRTVYHYGWN